ncbi:MAG: alpha-D-ribose 1-methylphosphonate 5-triphosphate diphosphatase [Rubricella sp.]
MPRTALPPIRFTNATVLRDGEMQKRSVGIAEGRFACGPFREVDLAGYLVLPGIVDLHGDGFEKFVMPRRAVGFDPHVALTATDAELAATGITTAWLAQSWSWEGGKRSEDACEALSRAIADHRPHARTDIRLQIRYETHRVETADRLLALVEGMGHDYVVFNNHLDQGLRMIEGRPHAFASWAAEANRTPEEHRAVIAKALENDPLVHGSLVKLAEAFDRLGIRYGSHDDEDPQTRERFHALGARICEFPTSREAASFARDLGDPVLMGAPNVVRGGSQSGNVSAEELVADGLVTALVSDYYYPAMALAAFRLADDGLLPFADAWALISTNAAEVMGLSDRGRVEPGLRADCIIVNEETRMIEATIAGGDIAHMAGEAAHRLASALDGSHALAAE